MSNGNERPMALTILSVVNFVWGGLGICGGLATVFVFGIVAKNPSLEIPPELLRTLKLQQLAATLLCLLLIVAGVGLWKVANWGRILSLVYAIAYIPYALVAAAFTPKMQQLMTQMTPQPGGPPPELQGLMNTVGVASGVCCGLIYPIVLLIVLNLKTIRAAFRGQPAAPPPMSGAS